MENLKNRVETKDLAIGPAVEEGVTKALGMIRAQFEEVAEGKDRLPYHNTRHTKEVIRRTVLILKTIRKASPVSISEREIEIGKLAASFHDVIQKWQENPIQEGGQRRVMRKRFVVDNEKASADAAIAFMDEANKQAGQAVFTDDDKTAIRTAIDATVPNWSVENKTVVQPNLTKDASLIALAVALADLGESGMDGPGVFEKTGNDLFREENLDILEAIRNVETITPDRKEYFRKRMLAWLQTQISFAEGRKVLLDTELKLVPDAAQEAVKALFDKFGASIDNAKNKLTIRSNMTAMVKLLNRLKGRAMALAAVVLVLILLAAQAARLSVRELPAA